MIAAATIVTATADVRPAVFRDPAGSARVQDLIEKLRLSGAPEDTAGTLYLRIYRELRGAIIAGAVAPGDLLSIRPIAGALRTSPMPVREALGRLAAEGALEPLPNRAFRIPVIGPEKYRELLLIRLRLEGLATEHAAAHITTAELAALQRVNGAIRSESPLPVQRYLSLNRDFHHAIYRASRLPALVDMIDLMWLRIGPIIRACHGDAARGNTVERHNVILAALERGDCGAAARAMQDDLISASTWIIRYLEAPSRFAAANGDGRLPDGAGEA